MDYTYCISNSDGNDDELHIKKIIYIFFIIVIFLIFLIFLTNNK